MQQVPQSRWRPSPAQSVERGVPWREREGEAEELDGGENEARKGFLKATGSLRRRAPKV